MSAPSTTGPITSAADIALKKDEILFIQNLSTSPLYVRLGPGATANAFHIALKACAVNDDGTGGTTEISDFGGAVSLASASVRFSAFKRPRRSAP
jgi:hypothetical protein